MITRADTNVPLSTQNLSKVVNISSQLVEVSPDPSFNNECGGINGTNTQWGCGNSTLITSGNATIGGGDYSGYLRVLTGVSGLSLGDIIIISINLTLLNGSTVEVWAGTPGGAEGLIASFNTLGSSTSQVAINGAADNADLNVYKQGGGDISISSLSIKVVNYTSG